MIRVRAGSKIKELVDIAMEKLEGGKVELIGEGKGCTKCVTIVEIVK